MSETVEAWKSELQPEFPENDEDKAIEFVVQSHPSKLVLDHGKHCTCCGNREKLISNPSIPRVLCMECYTWAVMEVKDMDREAASIASSTTNGEGENQ